MIFGVAPLPTRHAHDNTAENRKSRHPKLTSAPVPAKREFPYRSSSDPDAIASVVRRSVTIEHEIEGLPEGLVLQDVTVQDDGFRANLRGEDVKLTP